LERSPQLQVESESTSRKSTESTAKKTITAGRDNQFIKMSQINHESIQTTIANQGASIKNLENQTGQLSRLVQLVTTQVSNSYDGNTVDNPNKETCKALEGGVENKKREEK
jgi:hypothetical protein